MPALDNESNSWTTEEAAAWAGVPERRLSGWLSQGLLPAIPVGRAHVQTLNGGKLRRRSCNRWIIPKKAFIAAWEHFQPVKKIRRARTAA